MTAAGQRVRRVRVRGLELVPERPTETAAGTMVSTPLVLIDVLTEDGITGRGYVRAYLPVALPALARLVEDLGALIEGGLAAPAAVAAALRGHLRLLGTAGLVGAAVAGLDVALWDALAQAAGVPLATLLGGSPGPVPAYASLRTMAPAAAAAEAEGAVAAGFRAVKLKVGGAGLDADLAAIRAVRGAVGDGVRLMVDYNQSLSVPEAVDRVRALDDEGLAWIEEPVRADDVAGNARVAAAARTAIQLGENWAGPDELAACLAAGACDLATLDLIRIGGVTGWQRAAALAAAAGLPVSSHTYGEVSAHLLAATPTAHWLEYLDHAGPILHEPLRVAGGLAVPSTRPGAGLEWDEERIAYLLR